MQEPPTQSGRGSNNSRDGRGYSRGGKGTTQRGQVSHKPQERNTLCTTRLPFVLDAEPCHFQTIFLVRLWICLGLPLLMGVLCVSIAKSVGLDGISCLGCGELFFMSIL